MEQKSTFMPALQFGLLIGLAMSVYILILFLASVRMHSSLNLIVYLIFVGGMYWGMIKIREEQLESVMSYGKAFGIGFWISFFAAILLGIFTFIYVKYINPPNPSILANKLTEVQDKILTSNPNISDADLQKALDMVKISSSSIVGSIIGFLRYLISGTVFSLIIAIFAKREDRTLM